MSSFIVPTGAFFGQLFEWSYIVNKGRMNNSAWTWHQTSIFKSMLRVAITCLISVGILAGIEAFRPSSKNG